MTAFPDRAGEKPADLISSPIDREAQIPLRRSGNHWLWKTGVWAAPYILLLLFTIALFWPLARGERLYWGDILLYFDPMSGFAQSALRNGRIPLWNPYVICGQPFVGNPQISLFYPATLLLPFLSVGVYLNLLVVLHLFLCGALCYTYLRHWTARKASALAGAMTYMGSACLVSRAQFPPMIVTAAYLPLLLRHLDRCVEIEKAGVGKLAALAVVVALTLLAAHTQIAYFTLALGILYGAGRCWRVGAFMAEIPSSFVREERLEETTGQYSEALPKRARQKNGKEWRRRLLWASRRAAPLTLSGVVGLLLASVYILPTLQLVHESVREKMTVYQANRFVLELPHLLTLLWPRFVGHPASGDYWAGDTAWEPSLFLGWIPLVLIGWAVLRERKHSWVRFWTIFAAMGVWLAFGISGGLYWIAFYAVPGVARFHDPARFLFITTFAGAMLAARGFDHWCRWLTSQAKAVSAWRWQWGTLLTIALPLWWWGQDWNPTTTPENADVVPNVFRPILSSNNLNDLRRVTSGRIYLPLQDLIWRREITEGYRDYGRSDAIGLQSFFNTALPNLAVRSQLISATGYEPVPLTSTVEIDGLARIAIRRGEPNLLHLLELMRVSNVTSPSATPILDASLSQLHRNNVKDFALIHDQQVRYPMPLAWLVRRVHCVDGKTRLLSALAAPNFDPMYLAIVPAENLASRQFSALAEMEKSDFSSLEPSQTAEQTEAMHVISQTAESLKVEANVGALPALMVCSLVAYPGWTARVDGQKTEMVVADGAFMGVPLSPGKHSISILYRPEVFHVGLYLTLITATGLVGVSVYALLRFGDSRDKERLKSLSFSVKAG